MASYQMEFFNALKVSLVKKNCPHCHESGFAGREIKKGWLLCRCVGKTIEKYRAIAKENRVKRIQLKALHEQQDKQLNELLCNGNAPEHIRKGAERMINVSTYARRRYEASFDRGVRFLRAAMDEALNHAEAISRERNAELPDYTNMR